MMGLSVLVQFIVRTRFVSAENSSVLKAFSEPPVVSRAESHSCTIRSRNPLRITFLLKKGRGRVPLQFHSVRNKKCQIASPSACTIADAKIDPVFRHVHP